MSKKRSDGFSRLLLIAIVFLSCFYIGYLLGSPDFSDGVTIVKEKEIDFSGMTIANRGWFYQQLDADGRTVYNALVEGLPQGVLTFSFSSVKSTTFPDSMSHAIAAITYEHPEFFWISGSYRYWESVKKELVSDFRVELMCYDYWSYTATPQEYIDRLDRAVERIASEARQFESEYERARYVHDYIVSRVDYNYVAADETTSTVRKATSEQAYSAYGCLVDDNAICGGYSKGFQLVMIELGIDCLYARGMTEGGHHAWNCVSLAESYYFFDLAWDDPGLTNEDGSYRYPHGVVYTYFGLTTEGLSLTHTLSDQFQYPYCEATDYHYFRKEGLFLETFSLAGVDAVLTAQKGQDIAAVAFSTKQELERAVNALFDNSQYRELNAFADIKRFSYTVDYDHAVITFYL
ncbi:MAG: hypothetical protein E7618_00290 [Ruminococcaceae bacterium]|nr:hypothetical protein [Oscillospiraceae bacterium]